MAKCSRFFPTAIIFILFASFLVTSFNTKPVLAYTKGSGGTHYFILDQARTILGNDGFVSYQEFLDSLAEPGKTYLDKMKEGSDIADTWDTFASGDHYMSPLDHVGLYSLIRPWAPQFGSAALLCQQKFDEALDHWNGGNRAEAMKDLGWAAHLVQDLCVPFHAAEDMGGISPNRHVDYENWVQNNQNAFAVYSDGEYSIPSFPDRQYYPTSNSDPYDSAGWHYNGLFPMAYDWVDYNAHEGLQYYQCVNYATGEWNNYAEPCIETVHSLPNNLDSTWTITRNESTRFQLHFSRIDISAGDYVLIYDENDTLLASYTGVYATDWWAPSSSSWYNSGDTLKIRTTTDGTGTSWGYDIHDIKSNDIGDDLEGATSILLPRAQRATAGFIKFFFDWVGNTATCIEEDGSVNPFDSPIVRNGELYTFTNSLGGPFEIKKDNIVIDGNGYSIESYWPNIGFGYGIQLLDRFNVTVENLTITGFQTGAFAGNSTSIILYRNFFENNDHGARLFKSTGCCVSSNIVTANSGNGIWLFNSSYNEISSNYLCQNGLMGVLLNLSSCWNQVLDNNITQNYDGINTRYQSYHNNICGNNVTFNQRDGLELDFGACYNIASNNVIEQNNRHGIEIYDHSNDNMIVANSIESNSETGLWIFQSHSNSIFHNNIVDNAVQTQSDGIANLWDDGYPSGGNCWSDYAGLDMYSGLWQNETGSDGIGDSSRLINGDNRDRYPLMDLWTPDNEPPEIDILSPLNQTYFSDSLPLIFNISEPTSWIGYSLDGQPNATIDGLFPSFEFRKSHIINSSIGTGTNYQVRIVVWRTSGTDNGENVYVGTKCRADFGDIRFTEADGFSELDYWLETYDGSKGVFWVEIKDDLSYAPKTIYIYYGNKDAHTTSNGTNTFLIFRDLTSDFYRALGDYRETALNGDDPGDYFLDGSSVDSKYVGPCLWFRKWGWKQCNITSSYIYVEGRLQSGNYGNVGVDLRVRDGPTPSGWQTSMAYIPNAFLDLKHVIVTDYSGIGNLYYYSTFEDGGETPEGILVDSFRFNSTSRIVAENAYEGNIAHIASAYARSDCQFTVFHQFYAAAKYANSEPMHDAWGIEENGNTTLTSLSDGLHSIVVYANDTNGNEGSSGVTYFSVYATLHDVAVTSVIPLKTIVGMGYSMRTRVGVTNEGENIETFTVAMYNEETVVSQPVNLTLSAGDSSVTELTWNTNDTGIRVYANYTLKVVADVVPGETDIADNNRTFITPIHVGVPGDVSSSAQGVYDKKCDMKDIAYLVILFNTRPSSPNWNPNADVNNDGVCSMKDIAIAILNFNKHE
jgi:parallel beta-helix repeat protein